MSLVSLLLNVIWIVFGGLPLAVGWLIASGLMIITIVGIPWAAAAFRIASYSLLPFGRRVVRLDGAQGGIGSSPVGTLGNLIWLILAGWWLALGHLFCAVGCAVTIIGLPFAWAHLKLAGLSLWPIGTEILTDGEYEARAFHLG